MLPIATAICPNLSACILPLFAVVEPTWTDKEVLEVILKVLGVAVTIGAVAVPLCTSWARRKAKAAVKERDRVAKENEKLANRLALKEANLERASDLLRHAQEQAALLEVDKGIKAQEVDEHFQMGEELKVALAAERLNLDTAKSNLEVERRRVQRALAKDGQTWTEKVLSNAPEFKPLEPDGRRTPVVAVLNLKGGVGKTTITANLGAALDHLGYRVLMLDLDLQGSLTGLFLSGAEQVKKHDCHELLGDFFFASYEKEFPNLLDYSQPILPERKSSLVPTDDALVYAETNLVIRWNLRDANKDPRFLLRRELHLKRITSKFDVVLLDCPPLLNITCINALAASDYVLVPIMPSKQVTSRVPVLLNYFKKIRANVNPGLHVLGMVSNRTYGSALTKGEQTRLNSVRDQCKDILAQDVPCFPTIIQISKEIRDAEDSNRALNSEDAVFQRFQALAAR